MHLFDLFEEDATEGKIIHPDRINLYLNLRRPNAQPIRIAHNIPYKAMDAVIAKLVSKYSDVEADMFEFRPANSLREDSGENDLYAAYDKILIDLCDGIVRHQKQDSDRYGLVAAAVVDPDHRVVYGINHKLPSGKRVHAERAAMANYIDKYGEIPEHSVIITTLSPCVDDMPDRKGPSCTELLNGSPITRVYAGYRDPSQTHLSHDAFDVVYTEDKRIESVCKDIADCFLDEATIMDPADYRGEAIDEEAFNGIDITLEIQKDDEYVDDDDYDNQVMYVTASSNGRELGHVLFAFDGEYLLPQDLEVDERYRGQGIAKTMYDYVKSRGYKIRRSGQQTDAGAGFWDKHKPGKNVWENFADGKKPGRRGLSKRMGVNTKASVSSLRKTAKHSTGEKARMAHWLANMKAGKAKKK